MRRDAVNRRLSSTMPDPTSVLPRCPPDHSSPHPIYDASGMDVAEQVRASGGIVPSARLVALGTKSHLIQRAVDDGTLLRVRRRWVAVPEVDAYLLGAARRGVVLSCVTQARRRGLWVLGDDQKVHVAARRHAGRIDAGESTTVHWHAPLVPRHPDLLEDPIENVLAMVAACQPREAALAVWESALRKAMVDRLAIGRLDLSGVARGLLAEAKPFSDSGLETIVLPRLAWTGLRLVPQAWIAGHRVDLLIGERLVLQIDGGHHVGVQRTQDIEHDARLMLLGYHVIRVGYEQIVNDWVSVQDLVVRAIGQGLHRAA